MSNTLVQNARLTPLTAEQLENIKRFGEKLLTEGEPCEIATEHHIHAGVYSRTIRVPAGAALTSVIVKCPTQFIGSGDFTLTDGATGKRFKGYHVFDGAAPRVAGIVAHSDCAFTMLFATNAKTVEEAEKEFTDETDRLVTSKEKLTCQQ